MKQFFPIDFEFSGNPDYQHDAPVGSVCVDCGEPAVTVIYRDCLCDNCATELGNAEYGHG